MRAYSDHTASSGLSGGPMFFAHQSAGPNLSGERFCGIQGPFHPPGPTGSPVGTPRPGGGGTAAPAAAERPAPTELRLTSVRWRGRRLRVRALLAPRGAGGSVTIRVRAGAVAIRRTRRVRDGVVNATLRLPARHRRARLELRYSGGPGFAAATLRRTIRR